MTLSSVGFGLAGYFFRDVADFESVSFAWVMKSIRKSTSFQSRNFWPRSLGELRETSISSKDKHGEKGKSTYDDLKQTASPLRRDQDVELVKSGSKPGGILIAADQR